MYGSTSGPILQGGNEGGCLHALEMLTVQFYNLLIWGDCPLKNEASTGSHFVLAAVCLLGCLFRAYCWFFLVFVVAFFLLFFLEAGSG